MSDREVRIGAFACNCNALQILPDDSILLLLVCGDQENFVSRIVCLSADMSRITQVITMSTWVLSMHFDAARQKLLCSTAGGRIVEIASGKYDVLASDLPFVSGFRSLPNGRLLAFGWHGLIAEFDSEWVRFDTGERRRIFDLKPHLGEIFVCGDSGLLGNVNGRQISDLGVQTDARLRRLCSHGDSLLILSQAPAIFRLMDGAVSTEDTRVAPGWDAVTSNGEVLLGFGYEGLFRYEEPGLRKLSPRHAFHLAPWADRMAVLSDSLLWIWDKDSERQLPLDDEYRDMLETYGLA